MEDARFAANFAGAVPADYDRLLVPLIFRHYGEDLSRRAARHAPHQVLELAAGTGAVTRCLAEVLPAHADIVATDLNQAMIDRAAAVGTARPVTWRQANAQQLPFADGTFDLVVCQFGVMFFPDRPLAFAEARRVLAPGGRLLFNTWDGMASNELAACIEDTLAMLFPADASRFLSRVPHGYHDATAIAADLRGGGFTATAHFSTVPGRSEAGSARVAAEAYCLGTPLRVEIELRRPGSVAAVTAACEAALAARFGAGPISALMQALVVEVAA
jgi:ubiquinone/menaquinone biosynthesis C-methylase UbiE